MKTLTDFIKMTLVGGLLVVLPLWVSVLLLVKAIKRALVVLHPLAKLLPQTLVHPNVVAFCLLVLICFAVGVAHSHRIRPALRRLAGTPFSWSRSRILNCAEYDSTVSWSERRAVVPTCSGR